MQKIGGMRICLIGAGKLATQLGLALSEKGHQIVQVWSRTLKSAADLASKLNCDFTSEISSIYYNTDIYIISVSDKAIDSVLVQRNWGNTMVVHTAGSTPMSILASRCTNFGVFYPFQTFTIEKKVDFNQIPVCIEANTPQNLELLRNLAQSISQNVRFIDSDQRQQIHLAAVFVCNFVNHFYKIGKELLLEKGLDFTEEKVLPSQDPALLARSPLGKIPFIETEDGVLSESQVILEFLEDNFTDIPLYPSQAFERAKCRELIQHIELNIELHVRRLYKEAFFGGSVSEETKAEVLEKVVVGVHGLARLVKFSPFIAGDVFTVADCVAVAHFFMISEATQKIYGEDKLLAIIPHVAVYNEVCNTRPAVQKVIADRAQMVVAMMLK